MPLMHGRFPFVGKILADGGYQGPQFRQELAIEIAKRPDAAQGCKILPRLWVVERTFAWLNRCRRLAEDFENLTHNALIFIRLASNRLMLRKLGNSK